MFDVFAVQFSDGREICMIAKDAEKAYALAENAYPAKKITKIWHVTNDDYDH